MGKKNTPIQSNRNQGKLLKSFFSPFFLYQRINPKRAENQKGAVLIIVSLIVLIILLVLFISVSSLLTKERKIFESLQKSPVSLYAADSGAERILYMINKQGYSPPSPYPLEIMNVTLAASGSSYKLIATSSTSFKSIGTLDDISRSIEVSY